MALWAAIGRQLRHPSGLTGRAVGRLMRLLNARPNALAVAALDIQAADEVLELGCGPGDAVRLTAARVACGRIHAIDQSEIMLAQTRSLNREAVRSGRVRLYRTRFEALPFASGSMDKILAVNVAYFWRDGRRVLAETRRVLRADGVLSIYVTEASIMRRWKFAGSDTHRLFDRSELANLLRSGGFCPQRTVISSVRVMRRITGLIATVRKASDPRRAPRAERDGLTACGGAP
jgi:SAM-dependent methyltransferase